MPIAPCEPFTPDFFIIGFPKCGTTSLASALSNVEGLHLASLKEPHFFTPEVDWIPQARTEEAYRTLFSGAKPGDLTFEASTWYAYSPQAITQILERNPAARFIVCLRDPVGMMRSLHVNNLRDGYETEADPLAAWRRSADPAIPPPASAPHPLLLDYRDRSSLGTHLQRIAAVVPNGQLHALFLEDLAAEPELALDAIACFLGVPAVREAAITRENPARAYRFPLLRAADRLLLGSEFGRRVLHTAKAVIPRGLARRLLFRAAPQSVGSRSELAARLGNHRLTQMRLIAEVAGDRLATVRATAGRLAA